MRLKAGRAYIKAPKNIDCIYNFCVKVRGMHYAVAHVDARHANDLPHTLYGIPSYFWRSGDYIYFAPKPDKNYYAEMRYTELKVA